MQEQHGVDQGAHDAPTATLTTEYGESANKADHKDDESKAVESATQNLQLAKVLEEQNVHPRVKKQLSQKINAGFVPDKERSSGETPFLKWLFMFLMLMSILAMSAVSTEANEPDRNRYYETGYDALDQAGTLDVNAPEILYGDHFTMAMTVNIYDGTVTVFSLDGNGGTEQVFQTHALVGQRLLSNRESKRLLSLYPDQFPSFEDGGLYDFNNGVYRDNYGLRHTLTPPMIADFQGFGEVPGFGGLDVATDIAFIRSMSSDGRVSGYNSQYTFHEVPPLENDHYNQRRALLAEANTNGVSVENPYWSHGCVNIDPEIFPLLKDVLSDEEDAGGNVVVIFSTPGQDQSIHFRGPSFNGLDDVFFERNLIEAADLVDLSQPIYTREVLTPDVENGDGGAEDTADSSSSSAGEPDNSEGEGEESAAERANSDETQSEVAPTEVVTFTNWNEGETFLDYSVSERAPAEIRELPFFARDMITVYIEESQLRDSSLNREELAQEGLALWEFAFPDGDTNPSQRTEVQSDIFDALYLGVDTWTMADVRVEWLRGAYSSN